MDTCTSSRVCFHRRLLVFVYSRRILVWEIQEPCSWDISISLFTVFRDSGEYLAQKQGHENIHDNVVGDGKYRYCLRIERTTRPL